MYKGDAAVVEADNHTVGASGESVSNDESQLEKRVWRTRSPSRKKLPDDCGPRLRLNSGSNPSCDRSLFNGEKPEAPSLSRRSEKTSVAWTGAPKASVVKLTTTLNIGIPRSVDTLITERRFRESASRATGSLCKIFNEQCSVALKAAALSRHRGSTEIDPVIPRFREELNEPIWQWTPNETTCADTAPTDGHLLVPELLPCQDDENAAKDRQRFPTGIHGMLVSRQMHTGRFENDLSGSSLAECVVPPELMLELGHSSLYPKHLPTYENVGSRRARTTPDMNVYNRGSRIVSKPGVQPQAPTVEKVGPSGHPAGRHETQVMTVLVSNLTARGALSAEKMDRDSVRLFSKPTTSARISPTGTRAGPSSAGKMPTDIASAKAGAPSGTFPVAMTSRGPGVMPQAPVIGRANGVVRTGVGATSIATPGYATSPVSVGSPSASGKRPSVPRSSQPVPPTAALPPSTAHPSQAQGPAAKGPAVPGGNATVTPNPGVAPAAASATAVGAVPTSYGPAFNVGQTAQPASANSFTIGPGPGFAVAEIGASRGVPTVGTGAPMPFSPVLESALFADSEGDEKPDYELSDTTILDVNPCLLLPLSGCNFFFIAASIVVFLGALYAYFDQESTPTATSANTWLVYLLLHLEIVLMVLSLGVFIVASIGFIGALRENIELLDLYATLQGSFVTAEVVFIVMIFFLPIIGREFVISHITTEFIVHYRDKLDYQREIDYVQSSLHCCGMTDNSYRDWNANPYFNCSPTNPSAERCSVPPSCCRITKVPDIVDYDSGTGAREAEPVKASKNGAPESASASADGDVYVTTLCGRGVMNLKEQDAWKRIYTRGCGAAMFHFIESRVVELVLYTCVVILVHLFLTALAVDVRKEIAALAKVYDKYYKVVYRGQKRMKFKEAATERSSPQDPPLVASKEARRQRHRRRYLDARPPWQQLSKQIASPAAASSL